MLHPESSSTVKEVLSGGRGSDIQAAHAVDICTLLVKGFLVVEAFPPDQGLVKN